MSKDSIFGDTKFSVLDLVPVVKGDSPQQAMKNSLNLAQHVEKLGFERIWISEHHNMESLVSSATPLLIGYLAQGTTNIRVGAGGVMLPNHAPLIVAEQFGTLETLYPGRIDLGLGRAPGTDPLTTKALRRERIETVNDFPQDVQELRQYFSSTNKSSPVRAIPGEGLEIPMYILGSSTYSAQMAGYFGLPYAFASHFAPAFLHDALGLYHSHFKASQQLSKPYAMAGVNVIAADTDEEAEFLASSMKLMMLNIIRNTREPMSAPVESMDGLWTPVEEAHIINMMKYAFIGSKETIERQLSAFIEKTRVDEVIVVSHIYDHQTRLKSFDILKDIIMPKVSKQN